MKLCLVCKENFHGSDWRCPSCGSMPTQVNSFLSFAPELSQRLDGEGNVFLRLKQIDPESFWWFRSRNRLLVWALRRYFPEVGSFLEIGCGIGFVLDVAHRAFPQCLLVGSEILSELLPLAQERVPKAFLCQMDARRIPFQKEFDVVGAFDLLEHVVEDTQVLAQIFQATKPGGGILLTVPQHPILWSEMDAISHHQRRYTKENLLRKVREAGFDVVEATSFVSLLLPLMFISRLRFRKRGSTCDPLEEHWRSRFFQWPLRKSMDLERWMIQRGISFPAGGSLLVVARRRTQ